MPGKGSVRLQCRAYQFHSVLLPLASSIFILAWWHFQHELACEGCCFFSHFSFSYNFKLAIYLYDFSNILMVLTPEVPCFLCWIFSAFSHRSAPYLKFLHFHLLQVACEPLAEMIKNHFVDIFSVCITLHSSKKAGWEKGSAVLEMSILDIAKISETERDKLIKKHMVWLSFIHIRDNIFMIYLKWNVWRGALA